MAQGKRSFGQITKLPSKRHRARYTGPDTALHNAPVTFQTKGDAEAWLTDERRLISAGTWTSPAQRQQAAREAEASRESNTFATYARAWLAGRHELRESTRLSYTTAVDRHLVPPFGHLPVDKVTATAVRAWFASYGERTPTARAHAYQVLSAIMRTAEDDGLITRSPCRVKAGGRAKVAREPEVLTLPELLALADAMPRRHRAITLVCGMCGLRFGEAAALRRRDIDLDAGTVTVARTATRAGGVKSAGPPKTDAGRRRVSMPRIAAEAVRAHLASQPVQGRDALVFPGLDGAMLAPTALYGRTARIERTRDGRTYQKAAYGFHGAREAIGRPSLHFHDLRRTAATLGAQSGATVREIQHRLGHTTAAMALYYQQSTTERDRAIADRLQAQVDALGGTGDVAGIETKEAARDR